MGERVRSNRLVRRAVSVAAGGLAGVAGALALWSGPASAVEPACTVSWVNPAGGSWEDGANWSTGTLPGGADDVCIDLAGTYQVAFDGTVTVRSLSLGGASGTQTLAVHKGESADGLRIDAAATVQANGVLQLASSDPSQSFAVQGMGGVVNHGILRFAAGPTLSNFYGDLTNAAGGQVEVDGRAEIAISAVVNDGALDIDLGGDLYLLGGSFASNSGSSIAVGGRFEGDDLTFTQAGGTLSGNPIVLGAESALVDSAGTGSFTLSDRDITLSGTIPVGQTVTILATEEGSAQVALAGPVVNNGTLRVDATDAPAILNGPGHLTNNGTLRTVGEVPGDFAILGSEITNAVSAIIEVGSPSSMFAADTTNHGMVDVQANARMYVDHSTFTSNAGSTLELTGGAATVYGGTFRQAGGDIQGSPVVLLGGSTLDTSSGPGSFLLEPAGEQDNPPNIIKGTIAPNQLVTVRPTAAGDSTAILAAPGVINNGVLRLDSSNNSNTARLTGAPLTNNRFLVMMPGPGARRLEASVTIGANGELAVGTTTSVDGGAAIVNNGRISLSDDSHLVFLSGSFTNSAAGTLRVTVNTTVTPSGRVSVLGGTITAYLGGTLEVTTIGLPVLGRSYVPVTVTSRVGTFAKVTSDLPAYEATYSSTAVGLVASPPRARFVPFTPTRILDTRTGNGAPQARVPAGGVVNLSVAGLAGSGPAAVALTVTTTESSPGYVTVWPGGEPRPVTSNLNTTRPGQTLAVQVIVPVGSNGEISLFTSGGGHLIADLAGWYEPVASSTSGRFNAVAPSRLLDTRSGTGAPAGRRSAGASLALPVTGHGGVPATGVSSVVLSVTEVDASPGWVTVWPSGQARPAASNLNTDLAGQTVAAHVTVPVGAGGAVNLFTSGGGHLLVDVVGWFTDATAPDSQSGLYVALSPTRRIDTRTGQGVNAAGIRPAKSTTGILLGGSNGIPASGVAAVVATLTATQAAPTYLTAWAGGSPRPQTSNLNVTIPGDTVPNLVTSPVGSGAFLNLYTDGATHLLLDTTGYYTN